MHTQTRNMLPAVLVMGGSVLEAAASSYELLPYHDWTLKAGRREFGFKGYSPEGYPPPTFGRTYSVVHYGFGESRIRRPVHVVTAAFVAVFLLICVGGLFTIRRRS